MHAIAVALARLLIRKIGVPDVRVDLGQLDAGLSSTLAEQAELDAVGDLGEDREVHAAAVVRGA